MDLYSGHWKSDLVRERERIYKREIWMQANLDTAGELAGELDVAGELEEGGYLQRS